MYNRETVDKSLSGMLTSSLISLIQMLLTYMPEDKHLLVVELRETSNQKIMMIKLVRSITSCGLKEAKDFVEGSGYLVTDDKQADILQQVYKLMGGSVIDFNNRPPF